MDGNVNIGRESRQHEFEWVAMSTQGRESRQHEFHGMALSTQGGSRVRDDQSVARESLAL